MLISPRPLRILLPLACLVSLASAPPTSAQTTFVGVEPNQNKFEATPAPNMVAGDMLEALECTSISRNVFRVGTAPAPLAIYRHRLTAPINPSNPSDQITLQGRGAVEDLALPQSIEILADSRDVSSSINPFVAWYGFGKSEELYVDLDTVGACRSGGPARVTLSTETVVPTVLNSVPRAPVGGRRLTFDVLGVTFPVDSEVQLFDSEFNALYAGGSDEPFFGTDNASMTQNLDDGRYYIAVSDHELATHLPPTTLLLELRSPSEVMDFRGGVVNGSAEFPLELQLRIRDTSTGTVDTYQAAKTSPFEVLWFQFDVGATQASSSFCAGDGSLGPCPGCSTDAPLGSGTGCRNSTDSGAPLTYFRTPGFFGLGSNLLLEGIPTGAPALVFVSTAVGLPIEIGGGLFCLQGSVFRQAVVTGRLDGMARLPIDLTAFPAGLLGQTVYAQAIYRDEGSPCGLNASSGTSFLLL